MSEQVERFKVLGAGILSLILMVGIARFSYTPLLPIMQQQTWLGDAAGGWLAAFNYLGYICGAVIAMSINSLILKDQLYRAGIIVAILTTAGMAMSDNMIIWVIMRFFAGLSSAGALLLGSALILNWLIRHNHHSELGIHFTGIGLGIVFCSVVIEVVNTTFNWQEIWYLLAILGFLIAVPAWRWLPKPDTSTMTKSGTEMVDKPPPGYFLKAMLMAYFCAGFGYVVTATFIVAIVERQPGLQGSGTLAFLVIGLAATPACIVWDLIARRTGELTALLFAFAIQVVGIALPIFFDNLFAIMLSAVLYGATFIGIVSLVLTMAGRFYPTKPAKLMAKITISYGVAQIAAPAISGTIAEQSGNYNAGLYMAAIFVAFGALLIAWLRKREGNA